MPSTAIMATGPERAVEPRDCARCNRPLAGRRAFALEGSRRCLRCALQHRPLLRRSLLTALVVGTVLVAINQGNLILAGNLSWALLWKMPLTYAVPFCVATWGALANNGARSAGEGSALGWQRAQSIHPEPKADHR